MTSPRRTSVLEPFIATVILIGLTRVLTRLPLFADSQLLIFAALGIYGPIALALLRRRPIPTFERTWRELGRGIGWFGMASLAVFPAYGLAAHLWQTRMIGQHWIGWATIPSAGMILTQCFFIALPEEFFFRGYVQPILEDAWKTRWRTLGASLGPGWIITCLVFAFAHSVVAYRWWHFAIFFPSLVFGYLRARTGGIVAPTLFHATANLFTDWLVHCYR
ncbi:MAG: CPBP family intramembrane metalloprotease [Deltaproteobacteria bacterium]|nr:CPBP family intramembrane metalloprotease [Deltaproteobacteria bacterium]